MIALLTLGFTLSLDNFRSSLVLGGLKPTFLQSVKTSAIFGLWDGAAPAVGILIGHFLSDKIDGTADTIGNDRPRCIRPVPHRPGGDLTRARGSEPEVGEARAAAPAER